MTSIVICNKCKQQDSHRMRRATVVPVDNRNHSPRQFDLCHECWQQLRAWIDNNDELKT